MSAGSSHLVENPYAEGNLRRQAIGKGCFDFLKNCRTASAARPTFCGRRGPVAEQRRTEKNCIAMVEAMVEEIDGSYWHSRRERLSGRFSRMKSSSALNMMDELMILRTFAAVTTVLAASLVATNLNARITAAGFMIFIVASIAWMIDGWLETKASLVIQNVILLVINVIGVWRWFPKAEKEAKR